MNLLVSAVLAFTIIGFGDANSTAMGKNPVMDPTRTQSVVDEAILEQKDFLLDMLETKLKEVRDNKKKKKTNRSDSNTITLDSNCESVPRTGDVKLSASGISAVGDLDVNLKFADTGKGTLKLNATGISNVGRSRLDMAVEDGNIHIPGIGNLFMGNILSRNCAQKSQNNDETEQLNPTIPPVESRRTKSINNNSTLTDSTENTTTNANTTVNVTETESTTDPDLINVTNVNESARTESVNVTVANETVNAV